MVIWLVFAAFIVGINAVCIPTPIQHTETGDEFYRALLKDLADVEIEASTIAKQVQETSCTPLQNLDFFTQLVVTIISDYYWRERLVNGTNNPTGSECIGVNLRIAFDLKSTVEKAVTPIPGPSCDQLTGAALSQYVLQKGGLALKAIMGAAANSGGSGTGSSMVGSYYNAPTTGSTANPGKWQKYVEELNIIIGNLQTIIANNDEPNCVAATRRFGVAFVQVLESAGRTTIVV